MASSLVRYCLEALTGDTKVPIVYLPSPKSVCVTFLRPVHVTFSPVSSPILGSTNKAINNHLWVYVDFFPWMTSIHTESDFRGIVLESLIIGRVSSGFCLIEVTPYGNYTEVIVLALTPAHILSWSIHEPRLIFSSAFSFCWTFVISFRIQKTVSDWRLDCRPAAFGFLNFCLCWILIL